MRQLIAGAALLAVALTASGCIPLIAIAYDQQKQEKLRQERAREQARADAAYEQAIRQIDADAQAAEAQAAEVAKSDPYAGCIMSAESQRTACVNRAAVMAASRNPTIRAMANAPACESGLSAALRLCEVRHKQDR